MIIKLIPEYNGSPIPFYYYGVAYCNSEEYKYLLETLKLKDTNLEIPRVFPHSDIESLRKEFFEDFSDIFQQNAKYIDIVNTGAKNDFR